MFYPCLYPTFVYTRVICKPEKSYVARLERRVRGQADVERFMETHRVFAGDDREPMSTL